MSDIVLELQNVSRIFGEGDAQVKALDNVSLSIRRGEFVLIVGSSGSGKSTLLNMIGLLDKPTSGKVILDGKETTTLNDGQVSHCLLYTSPSPRDQRGSRMPSSA